MNDYYMKDLLTNLTGINNGLLAWHTLTFCNSLYPLEAYQIIDWYLTEFIKMERGCPHLTLNRHFLYMKVSNEDWRKALQNEKDPDITEIQQFCAPIKDLEFKFSKFEQLIFDGILKCEVTGNKYGAFEILLSLDAEPNSPKDALFMKKFIPEDFKEEDK